MRRLLIPLLALAFCSCGDTQGCGGESAYTYPRDDVTAAPTRQAVRVRLTETGLASVAEGVPDLIAAGCVDAPADGTASCAMDPNPIYPNRVRFYMGSDSISPASYLAIDLDSMEGNIRVGLISDGGGAGRLAVTMGCDAPAISQCSDQAAYGDQYITGSLDMVVYPAEFAACFVNEDAPPGFVIRSMRFDVRPRIELGADLKPYLVLDREDVNVVMDVEFNIVVGAELSDPACDTDVPIFGDMCSFECGLINWGEAFTEFLFETMLIDDLLANSIVDLVLQQFAESTLETEGALDLGEQLPIGNPRATPTGFLFSATVAQLSATPPVHSPSVTGNTDNLGWNFDFDVGFCAEHGPCVPEITPPSFALPPAPDVGSQVLALDPDTGDPVMEDFDLALLLGDAVLQRAAFELFDSGGLCMNIKAEGVGGGTLVPTVAMVSLLAPGLADLAPDAAPVNIVLSPRYPPVIKYGSGQLIGEEVDSHLSIIWPELWIDLYPLVDDSHVRALTFTVDLLAGASMEATPTGDIALMIDRLELINVSEVYNEMTAPFDTEGLETLLGMMLPLVLTGDPIEVPLASDSLGMPFGVRMRAIDQAGPEGDYLAVFLRFCNGDAMADPLNTLCFTPDPGAGTGKGTGSGNLAAGLVSGPGTGEEISTVRVSATSDLASGADLELAYRVDGGPWFNFRGSGSDGLFALRHPRLAVEGEHQLEVVGRHRWRPDRWSTPYELTVTIDRPEVVAPRPTATTISMTPIPVPPDAVESSDLAASDPATGCNATGRSEWLLVLLGLLLLCVRARRR